jgi:hypothetical protein
VHCNNMASVSLAITGLQYKAERTHLENMCTLFGMLFSALMVVEVSC